MGWNTRQQAAIDFRDSKDLLVAAAAGSGKTSVMVERVIQLILAGEASIDEILAVTFTRAAASSMKEKIVSSLRQRIAQDVESGNMEHVERLKTQLLLVNDADICTFDSFAQKIVKENFQSIDIDPGAGVCDTAKSEILKNQALDEVLEEKLQESNPEFVRFMDSYADVRSLETIKKIIWGIYEKLMALPNPQGKLDELLETCGLNAGTFLKGNAGKEMISQSRAIFIKARKESEMFADILSTPDLKNFVTEKEFNVEIECFQKINDAFVSIYEQADDENPDINIIDEHIKVITSLYYPIADSYGKRRWQTNKKMGEACCEAFKNIKEEGKSLRDAYKNNYAELIDNYFYQPISKSLEETKEIYPMAEVLCNLIKAFDKCFMEKKMELGSYDFIDFNHFALKALEKQEVAEQYKSHFKYIFVDEYQDSNELQDELIHRISRDGNIFMVGDVKQSIYRFRQAEPQLFINRYKAYKGSGAGYDPGTVIDLNANYRSRQTVVDFVNSVFENIMEDYDDDARLNAGNPGNLNDNVMPQIKIVDVADNHTEDTAVQLEVRSIANIIKEKMKSDTELRFRDIAVLMRSHKGYASDFKKIFEEEGIPLYMEEAEGYFDAVEVAIAMNLLRTIDNIRQDLPLISVLYSPVFSFSCEELAKIRIARGNRHASFYSAFYQYSHPEEGTEENVEENVVINVEEHLFKKCLDAYEKLRKWQEESKTMPLPDFIWKLYRETGLYLFMGALPGGEQRQSNMRMLVSRAIAYSKEESGIYNFLLEIDKAQDRDVKVPPAGTVSESADAVRLMTIHKSKGLEYPCVIIAGAHKNLSNNSDDASGFAFNKSIGMALQYVSTEDRFRKETILGTIINKKNDKEALSEYIRILYVALTRAIKHLVIVGYTKNREKDEERWGKLYPLNPVKALSECKSFFDWTIPSLKGKINPEYLTPANDMVLDNSVTGTNPFENISGTEVKQEIIDRLSYQYPYMADVLNKAKYSVTELNEEVKAKTILLSAPESLDLAVLDEGLDAEDAAERGTIYHKIMEMIDFTNIEKCEPELILKGLTESGFAHEKSEAVIDSSKIKNFLNSELAKRMSAAALKGKLYKEAPFILQTKKDGRDVLVQGIIDCYFEEDGPDGKPVYILADYKTNKVKSKNETTYNHFRDMYKKQIDLYAEAIERIKSKDVAERYLILLDAGEAINI